MGWMFLLGVVMACIPSIFFQQVNGVTVLGLVIMFVSGGVMIVRNWVGPPSH